MKKDEVLYTCDQCLKSAYLSKDKWSEFKYCIYCDDGRMWEEHNTKKKAHLRNINTGGSISH